MDDRAIIEGFFRRDESSIVFTQEKYGNMLVHIAYNLLGDIEDAKECLNDALLSAWNSIPPNDPKHFSAYLATLVRRRAFDMLDKRTAQKRGESIEISEEFFELIPSDRDTESEFERLRINKVINDFLRTRNEVERSLFILRYFCSEPLKSVAESIGLSESAAKTKLWRMRLALRKALEKEDIGI